MGRIFNPFPPKGSVHVKEHLLNIFHFLRPRIAPALDSPGAAMPSFVDAADAAGAAQGSSALVVATGAAVAACAAGNDDSSVVVAAASSPSNSGTCRKRLRHTDFPNMSDTEYREICSADARSRRPRAIAAGSALCARTQREKSSSGGVTSTALLRRGGCQRSCSSAAATIGLDATAVLLLKQRMVGAGARAGDGSADFSES